MSELTSKSTESAPSNDNKLSDKLSIETKQEETPSASLEQLTINNNDQNESSDKENEQNPNLKQEQDDDDDDDDMGSSDDESEESSEEEMFIGLSKEEVLKMKEAMGLIQSGYDDHCQIEKKRRINEIQHQIAFNLAITVNDEEADFIADFVEEHNENLLEKLEEEGVLWLQSMQEMMEQKKVFGDNHNNHNSNHSDIEWPENDDDDEDWVQNQKKKKAKRKKKGKNTNLDGSKRCGRLLLNDALKDIEASWSKWSEARKKAWKNRKTAPNAYFYRFNVPGQPQKNGKWTKEQHALFMKRVLEFGVNDQWGLFSKRIPGRVGYQCSNYWRGLVKDGDVIDPNYHYDGKKLHFKRNTKTFAISADYRKFAITIKRDKSGVWKNLPKRHPKHPSPEYCEKVKRALAENPNNKKRKRKNGNNDDDEDWNGGKPEKKRRRRNRKCVNDEDDEGFYCTATVLVAEDENPMPDFIDIMTGSVVVKPAISPYGHVLSYDTWTKILRTSKLKNMCPFTLQKLSRRSLVKLTKENYDQYKDKIQNITKEQTDLLSSMNN